MTDAAATIVMHFYMNKIMGLGLIANSQTQLIGLVLSSTLCIVRGYYVIVELASLSSLLFSFLHSTGM